MNGQITVNSQRGAGSIFRFSIPLTRIAAEKSVAENAEQRVVDIHHSGRVLVAEDNAINQKVVAGFLARFGYQCDLVNNGAEAVLRASQAEYDLILMDYHMPQMDGIEATEEIRQSQLDSPNLHTPIIALTADIQPHVAKKFRYAGANDTLVKPFSYETIKKCLHKWMGAPRDKKADTITQAVLLDTTPLDEMKYLSPDGSDELIQQVISLYLEHSPQLIEQILQAADAQQADALFKAAHALKSSSANVGAYRLSALAKQLEQLGRKGELSEVVMYLDQLQSCFDETRQALQATGGEL